MGDSIEKSVEQFDMISQYGCHVLTRTYCLGCRVGNAISREDHALPGIQITFRDPASLLQCSHQLNEVCDRRYFRFAALLFQQAELLATLPRGSFKHPVTLFACQGCQRKKKHAVNHRPPRHLKKKRDLLGHARFQFWIETSLYPFVAAQARWIGRVVVGFQQVCQRYPLEPILNSVGCLDRWVHSLP